MRFTSEEAFDASTRGEPYMMPRYWVENQVEAHGLFVRDIYDDLPWQTHYDAAVVLAWLGY